MARRLHQTMADYAVIAISPALIMTLVGSLLFFLLTVFYQGEYPERLSWVMGCFVFAAVLIGRISIEEGLERAMPFGIALAIVVGIAANEFMEIQSTGGLAEFGWIINWGLIALVWWCAHRLTWDCTVIDDAEDASGEGLLQTAGIEGSSPRSRPDEPSTPEGTTSRQVPAGWWQRYVEHQRRPHAPGVWVVYFSLAALPLFGFGQWFIPAGDVGTRRQAFGLLTLYVASGLGLLVTSSFLGLRRYLRQRRIEMPTLMANLWLGMGAAMIVVLLAVAALLPRPSAEYAISELPFSVGSPGQQSSQFAPVQREGTKDDKPGTAPDKKPEDEEKTDQPRQGTQGEGGSQSSSGKSRSPGDAKSGDAEQASGSGEKSQQSAQGSQDKSGKQGESQSQSKEARSKGERQSEDRPSERQPARQQDNARSQESDASTRTKNADQQQPDNQQQQQQQPDDEQTSNTGSQDQPAEPPPSFEPPDVAAPLSMLAELFKWAFYAAFALVVAYFLWRYRAEVLAAIRDFLSALRDLLAGLWGGRRAPGVLADEPVAIKVPPSPFASYVDPFAAGTARRYSREELVRHSFEAFEAWSREHGCTREPDQTPHELARDVAKLNKHMAADARGIAELYARAAYARGELPTTTHEQLEQLWQSMRRSTVGVP